jgi:PAS domain-containing protein
MPQQEIEVILMRQLASYLAMPILVVDTKGDLVFFNEAAEAIVGRRFDETGTIRRGEFRTTFKPADENGSLIKREDTPLYIATEEHRPNQFRFWIQGMDGVARKIEGIAFPLEGQSGRKLGAVMICWETGKP